MATSELPITIRWNVGAIFRYDIVFLDIFILRQHKRIWISYLSAKFSLREPQYVAKWLICAKAKYLQFLNAFI